MKEKFIEFLTENNCFEQFKQNIRNKEDFDEYCNRTWNANHRWVTSAFDWEGSPEGHPYWNKLHIQWEVLAPKYAEEGIN